MRTGMEAVYTLLDIDRGVPEVWGSTYDVRDLLNAAVQLRDGKPLSDLKMNWIKKFALGKAVERYRTPTWAVCCWSIRSSERREFSPAGREESPVKFY